MIIIVNVKFVILPVGEAEKKCADILLIVKEFLLILILCNSFTIIINAVNSMRHNFNFIF